VVLNRLPIKLFHFLCRDYSHRQHITQDHPA